MSAVTVAADLSVRALLHPERLARLAAPRGEAGSPDVADVTDALLVATWGAPLPEDLHRAEIVRTVRSVTLTRLIERATDHPVSQVRAVLSDGLLDLAARLEENPRATAHDRAAAADIRRWANRPAPSTTPPPLPATPPGSPIGGAAAQGW